MTKVLYITASVVPYRTRFFNLLAKGCDLSVIFETGLVGYRNSIWRYSVPLKFRHHFLNHKFINKILAPLEIIFWVTRKWDVRIVGCINSKVEILAILYMRLLHIPFYLNLDGETFFEGNSLKAKIKRFIAKGAKKYLVAGRKAAENLKNAIGEVDIQVYNFSSLSEVELSEHYSYSHLSTGRGKCTYALVIGAYFLIKTELFKEIGWFDERYFFTPEDIAVSCELRKRGYECWVDADAEIIHYEGMTGKSMSPIQTATGPAGFVGAMMWRGGNTYIGYCLFTLLNLPYTVGQFIYHSLRSNRHGKPNRYNLLAKKEHNVLSVCFTRMTPKEVFVKFYKRIKK